MSRFDPNAYPDRLAFDAYARHLQAQEVDRLMSAARAWLSSLRLPSGHGFVHPVATSRSQPSPR
jgi:hypothetical protein